MNPTVSLIVVSYKTRDMTLECLRTARRELQEIEAEILVVDNASQDGSVAAIKSEFPDVILIESEGNLGFGAANNAAMERANGRYFLLLNSDAFPRPEAFQALLGALEEHPEVGAVGPRLLNRDGSLQPSCWRFPSPRQAWIENLGLSALLRDRSPWGDYRRWAHDRERVVDFVIGACLLVRREVWEKIGGFDTDFWMYSEETDWQKRMGEAGWEILFTPKAQVEHWGGGSSEKGNARISEQFFHSLDLYSRKHHGTSGLLSLRAAMVVGNSLRLPLWLAVWAVRPRKREAATAKIRLICWLLRRQTSPWKPPHRET